jgi:hypothetical protein
MKHGKDPEMRKKAGKLIKEQGEGNNDFQACLKSVPNSRHTAGEPHASDVKGNAELHR